MFFKFILILGAIAQAVAYDKAAASAWAQECAYGCSECPDDQTCGCTYFTTHALKHGSWGGGIEAVCKNLWSNLKNGAYPGWSRVGDNDGDVHKGDIVIINNGHEGDASHCCIGTGHGVVSCHNPGHRDVPPSSTWYSGGKINGVYSYSGSAEEAAPAEKEKDIVMASNSTIVTDSIISCGAHEDDACNCVYYARDRQPRLPGGLTTCQDKRNTVNSKHAAPGCVLFRTGDPTYCHAAYVTKVTSDTVHYDQSNWTHCKCSSDTVAIGSSAVIGYWCP